MNLIGKSIRITVMSIRTRRNNRCRQFFWRFFLIIIRFANCLKAKKIPAAITDVMQQVFFLGSLPLRLRTLHAIKLSIASVQGKQAFVIAAFNDVALVKNENQVSVLDC